MHSRADQSYIGIQVLLENSLKPLILLMPQTIADKVLIVVKANVKKDDMDF